ncbi:dihydroorotate dehydrogenase electron transfer subunit [Tepidibacillus marianensis]|uniref:dihydroorotate dehydrogenase electron transfer subunit n=1 Tax=Tepidibacillus marianensis TaxID=3131995 RepID=UPI0030CAEEA9
MMFLWKKEVTFVYRLEGEGTKIISQKKVGETIDLLGPLGNGFYIDEIKEGNVVLIGGGVGIPPLYYLGKQFVAKGIKVISLLGFPSQEDSFLIENFSELGDVKVATIDGSYGVKGTVLDLMNDDLDGYPFYSCGPKGMLRAIQQYYVDNPQIEGYFSLEERMGCGIGACYGCIVKVNLSYDLRGFKKVCSDGPVFPFREVIL